MWVNTSTKRGHANVHQPQHIDMHKCIYHHGHQYIIIHMFLKNTQVQQKISYEKAYYAQLKFKTHSHDIIKNKSK